MVIKFLVGIISLQHYLIMLMEMFFWEKRGPIIFKGFEKNLFSKTTAIAKNLGLYNGFIATGLFLSLFIKDPLWFRNIVLYLLLCIIVAGIYAGLTAEKSIFWKQSLLAIITAVLLYIN